MSSSPGATRSPTASILPAALTLGAVVVAILGAFLGSGAIGGTSVTEAADGWLSADATPVAPGGSAFSIWSVIYAGLALYAIWQLTRSARGSGRQRRLRPWAVASALLNALWLGAVQLDLLFVSVLVILALLAVLLRMLLIMISDHPSGWVEAVLTDGTFGLYLGWVSVATVANIAAWLAAAGAEGFGGWRWAAAAVIAVAAATGVGLAVFTRGRIAPALATSWGIAWIAVARTEGQWESSLLVWTAGIAAAVVLATAVAARLVSRSRP